MADKTNKIFLSDNDNFHEEEVKVVLYYQGISTSRIQFLGAPVVISITEHLTLEQTLFLADLAIVDELGDERYLVSLEGGDSSEPSTIIARFA